MDKHEIDDIIQTLPKFSTKDHEFQVSPLSRPYEIAVLARKLIDKFPPIIESSSSETEVQLPPIPPHQQPPVVGGEGDDDSDDGTTGAFVELNELLMGVGDDELPINPEIRDVVEHPVVDETASTEASGGGS